MGTATVEMRPEIRNWPATRPVEDVFVPLLNDFCDRDVAVVTLDDLAERVPALAPQETARVLRRAGWLYPMRTRGAWGFVAGWPPWGVGEFMELHARLRVQPDTPACIAGKSVAQVHNWLRRPTGATIGMPPTVKVPRCLDRYYVGRWLPQIDLDEVHGLPVWKPETLLVFMGSRPSRFPWEDIAEWLWEACENLDMRLLLAELAGRPRGAWMKTAYLVDVGERPDLGEDLAAAAPDNARGPYLLGYRERQWSHPVWKPVWVPKYEVMDYLLPCRWYPKVGVQPFEPPKTWGADG